MSKLSRISKLSKKLDNEVGEILLNLYENDYRNDFVHSQYVLYKSEFNLFKANKHIAYSSLIDITVSAMNLYIFIAQKAFIEIESIQQSGSKTYVGKCGQLTISFDKDSIQHRSNMICGNF